MPVTNGSRPRRLPAGLVVCETCDEARGLSKSGYLSVCFCQGVVCNWCGMAYRRPITDYYARDRTWVHVPYFALGAHRCPTPPESQTGEKWTIRPVDDDVRAYTAAVSGLAWAEVEERARARQESSDDGGSGTSSTARAVHAGTQGTRRIER